MPVENHTSSQQSGYSRKPDSRFSQLVSEMVFGILSLNIITGFSLAATPTDKAKKKNEETSILFIKRIFMFIARFF